MTPVSNNQVCTTEAGELKIGLSVTRAVLPQRLDGVPVLVLHSSNFPKRLAAATILSDLSLAECVKEQSTQGSSKEGENKSAHLVNLKEGLDDSVSEAQRERLVEVLKNYSDVFSTGELDLGETSLAKHRIDTGDARPMRQTLSRQPFHLLKKIDAHVKDMIKAGVIEAGNSPWTSNIVVVKKKDDGLRYCVDYRKVNSVTRRDSYP